MCFRLYTACTVCENKHLASLAFSNSHNLTALLGHKVLSQFYQCKVRMTSEEFKFLLVQVRLEIGSAQWKNLNIS